MQIPIEQHDVEIQRNLLAWKEKPILRLAYQRLYEEILACVRRDIPGKIVEIGSGIGKFKEACPECITTDIFPNAWIDQTENAYALSFEDSSVSNLILFDVFHHLKFPGSVLQEFKRVLTQGGRIIMCDPFISVLGLIVYGLFHHEPVGLFNEIEWLCPSGIDPNSGYYAAQGNATRIFRKHSKFQADISADWDIVDQKRFSALSYVLSGGFSKPALYGKSALPFIKIVERSCDLFPWLFATRTIVVLQKK